LRPDDRLRARFGRQLLKNALQMRLDCLWCDTKLPGDLLVRLPSRDEFDDRPLACRQIVARARRRRLLLLACTFAQLLQQPVDELQRPAVVVEHALIAGLHQDGDDAPVVIEHEARHVRFRAPRHQLPQEIVRLVG
jgi:hypothetical protein